MLETDVLVVGAGPTGLLLTGLLLRQGVRCRLVEYKSEPAVTSRALGIQARSMELFRNLGIVDAFLRDGQVARGARVFINGHPKASVEFDIGRDDTPYPYLFTLSQAKTEKILAEDLAARGMKVERGTQLVSFEPGADRVLCRLDVGGSEEAVSARYLVGCDGAHSVVRKGLGLNFPGGKYAHEFVMADAEVDWDLSHDFLHAFLDDRGLGVYFPQRGTTQARVITVRPSGNVPAPVTTETTELPATLAEVEQGFRSAARRELHLKNPAWVTRFHVHHRCVNRFQVGRVFLAGDAAHIHSPVGAQGMNTGLQDAANLAWKIACALQSPGGEKILDTYHAERFPVARTLLKTTDRLFTLFTTGNPILRAVRNVSLPVLARVILSRRSGRKRAFRFISQLAIRYRPSVAAVGTDATRVPNVKLADGRELFDLLVGYRFHILVFSRKPVEPSAYRALTDLGPWWKSAQIHWISDESAFVPFGVKDFAVLGVRPDGYLGFRSE